MKEVSCDMHQNVKYGYGVEVNDYVFIYMSIKCTVRCSKKMHCLYIFLAKQTFLQYIQVIVVFGL